MNCVVTTLKYFFIVLKGRLPPRQECSQCLLFIASSRGLAVGWVGWGWQPLCENKQESGDALITAFIFHCRTPHVPVSAADSHPALLPQQHRNHHVGVLKTDFLSLLKPRDPAADGEPGTTHSSTTLWAHPTQVPKWAHPTQTTKGTVSGSSYSALKQTPLPPTSQHEKNLRWVLHSNAIDGVHFDQWLLSGSQARMSCWHFLNLIGQRCQESSKSYSGFIINRNKHFFMQIFLVDQPQQHMKPQVTLQNQAKGNSHPEAKAIWVKKNTPDFSSPLRRSLLSQQGLRLTGRPINLHSTSMENKGGCYWGRSCTSLRHLTVLWFLSPCNRFGAFWQGYRVFNFAL